jgi:glyoxylase-like metal-dependent hydrolase (beta-lactamase superfamily II)
VEPDGIFLVDAQSAGITDRVVAALKTLSPAPIRFLVNTHVHGDHTGGNEKFREAWGNDVLIAHSDLPKRNDWSFLFPFW